MAIPLEDKFSDIVGKAARGLKLDDEQIAQASGLAADAVQALRDGKFDEAAALKVAPALGLKGDALVESGRESWAPEAQDVEGFAQFNTLFDDMTVNSYLAWDAASGEAVAFDTGADCSGVLDLLKEKNLKLRYILLTHTHGDHIFDLDRMKERTGAHAFVGEREPLSDVEKFAPGREWQVGSLKIESRLTWGHSAGGITFVIHGLRQPVAVVGDAVFAGSMGGGGVSYADALATNRAQILSLPEETVIAPGHGPLTTVGEEKIHNPFFP